MKRRKFFRFKKRRSSMFGVPFKKAKRKRSYGVRRGGIRF